MSPSLLMLQVYSLLSENCWFVPKGLRICGGTCQVSRRPQAVSDTCESVAYRPRDAWAPASSPPFPEIGQRVFPSTRPQSSSLQNAFTFPSQGL